MFKPNLNHGAEIFYLIFNLGDREDICLLLTCAVYVNAEQIKLKCALIYIVKCNFQKFLHGKKIIAIYKNGATMSIFNLYSVFSQKCFIILHFTG